MPCNTADLLSCLRRKASLARGVALVTDEELAPLWGTSRSAHLLINIRDDVQLGSLLVARDFDEIALINQRRNVKPRFLIHLQDDARSAPEAPSKESKEHTSLAAQGASSSSLLT